MTTFCNFLGCWAVLAHQGFSHSSRRLGIPEEEFAKKVAQGSIAEVKVGQLAEEKKLE